MWKLKHRLLGWDYIQWRNIYRQGIARVHVDGMGRAYYWSYPGQKVAEVISQPDQVLWLTCRPHKYIAAALVIDA